MNTPRSSHVFRPPMILLPILCSLNIVYGPISVIHFDAPSRFVGTQEAIDRAVAHDARQFLLHCA